MTYVLWFNFQVCMICQWFFISNYYQIIWWSVCDFLTKSLIDNKMISGFCWISKINMIQDWMIECTYMQVSQYNITSQFKLTTSSKISKPYEFYWCPKQWCWQHGFVPTMHFCFEAEMNRLLWIWAKNGSVIVKNMMREGRQPIAKKGREWCVCVCVCVCVCKKDINCSLSL